MNRILSSGAGAATNDHSGADEMLLQKCKMRRIDQMKQHLAQQPMPFALLMFLLRLPESLQDRKFLHVLSQLIAHNTSYAADCAHTLRLNHHFFYRVSTHASHAASPSRRPTTREPSFGARQHGTAVQGWWMRALVEYGNQRGSS